MFTKSRECKPGTSASGEALQSPSRGTNPVPVMRFRREVATLALRSGGGHRSRAIYGGARLATRTPGFTSNAGTGADGARLRENVAARVQVIGRGRASNYR